MNDLSKRKRTKLIQIRLSETEYQKFHEALNLDKAEGKYGSVDVGSDVPWTEPVKNMSDMIRYRVLDEVPKLREEIQAMGDLEMQHQECLLLERNDKGVLTRHVQELKADNQDMREEFGRQLRELEGERVLAEHHLQFLKLALIQRGILKTTVEERRAIESIIQAWVDGGGMLPLLEDEERKEHHYSVAEEEAKRQAKLEKYGPRPTVVLKMVNGKSVEDKAATRRLKNKKAKAAKGG